MKTKQIVLVTIVSALVFIGIESIANNEINLQIVVSEGIKAIIFSLLFFSLGMKLMKKTADQLLKSIPKVELSNDEKMLLEAGASHIKGIEAVGGKLTLTDKRLVFKSHRFNLQNHQQEIPINEIKAVSQGKGYQQKMVELKLTNNQTHKFLVELPSQWIEGIPRN
jgi:hypothetical protein